MRKVVHIGFGLVALSLRWLPYPFALAMAAGAFFFNWQILPRVGGKRIARSARGNDIGILLYPAIVFVAIALFRGPDRVHIAAAVWAILAFGDGCASLAGRLLPGVRLPWNTHKSLAGSLAFLFFGSVGAYAIARFVGVPATLTLSIAIIVGVATFLSAIAESLDIGVDDNLLVGITAGASLWWLEQWNLPPDLHLDRTRVIWLVVNLLLAIVGYVGRSVNVSGLVAGVLLGTALILFGGWPLYVVLLVFFVLGSATTKVGYKRKASMGIAQEGGGRRGVSHAFANVGVAAICAISYALISPHSALWLAAAVASLATAAADTTSSEIGQLLGRTPFLPLTLQRVAVGTEGAISIEGTLAGAVAAIITAGAGTVALFSSRQVTSPRAFVFFVCAAGAAILGSYIESVAGSLNRQRGKKISNGALNFFNTAVGAVLGAAFAALV